MEWKDDSSYSYQKGRRKGEVPPSVVSVTVEGVRIVIHQHIYTGDKWNVSCRDLTMDTRPLDTTDLEEAKKKGLEMVKNTLQEKIRAFQSICDTIESNGAI